MNKISAVIITKNEERNIQRCLNSIIDVVDEVIVVDSFSTDGTEKICNAMGVTFIPHEWEGYSKQKNFANAQANGDYILSLDADEALSETLKASIVHARNAGLNGTYRFNRLTNYCGKWIKHCGWYPDAKTRLFPKGDGIWKGDFVHEELTFNSTTPPTFLSGDLHHYSYYTYAEHLERVERYAQLGAEKLLEQGKTGSTTKGFFSAINRFFRMYIIHLGFLDGAAGFRICKTSAYAAYLKYVKLNEIKKAKNG